MGVWRVAMRKRAAKQKRRIAVGRSEATRKNEYEDVGQFGKKHHCVLNTCTHSKRTVLEQATASRGSSVSAATPCHTPPRRSTRTHMQTSTLHAHARTRTHMHTLPHAPAHTSIHWHTVHSSRGTMG